jgi:hypothetical protein
MRSASQLGADPSLLVQRRLVESDGARAVAGTGINLFSGHLWRGSPLTSERIAAWASFSWVSNRDLAQTLVGVHVGGDADAVPLGLNTPKEFDERVRSNRTRRPSAGRQPKGPEAFL